MPKNTAKCKTIILSLRVTTQEKVYFTRLAGDLPISRFIIDSVLKNGMRSSQVRAFIDKQKISQLLGFLGQSRIASNINQLAKAVNSGSLPVNEEVVSNLNEAVAAILWMRDELIKALKLKPIRCTDEAANDPKR